MLAKLDSFEEETKPNQEMLSMTKAKRRANLKEIKEEIKASTEEMKKEIRTDSVEKRGQ
jgi:hypothetical protein